MRNVLAIACLATASYAHVYRSRMISERQRKFDIGKRDYRCGICREQSKQMYLTTCNVRTRCYLSIAASRDPETCMRISYSEQTECNVIKKTKHRETRTIYVCMHIDSLICCSRTPRDRWQVFSV